MGLAVRGRRFNEARMRREFSSPFGFVEDAGLLYIADYGNQRIQVMTLTGEFVRAWGAGGTGPGRFGA